MSDISATTAPQVNWAQFASSTPNVMLETLESMLENYGPEDMGQALAQKTLGDFITALRTSINDTDQLPQLLKDLANNTLDSFEGNLSEMCPCSEEAAEAVANNDVAGDIEDSAEADAEKAEETANEGTGEAAPSTDEAFLDSAQLMSDSGESEESRKKKGGGGTGHFLEVLAKAMGTVQGNMLNQAKVHSDEMVNQSGDTGDAQLFTIAQSQYTAKMQMFNIYSSQVATSLKTIGEAMSGIARKQ